MFPEKIAIWFYENEGEGVEGNFEFFRKFIHDLPLSASPLRKSQNSEKSLSARTVPNCSSPKNDLS